MFDLVTVEDAVQIEPSDLGLPLPDAVSAVLRKNFIDKVVPEIGLVVALYDLQVRPSYLMQGNAVLSAADHI